MLVSLTAHAQYEKIQKSTSMLAGIECNEKLLIDLEWPNVCSELELRTCNTSYSKMTSFTIIVCGA